MVLHTESTVDVRDPQPLDTATRERMDTASVATAEGTATAEGLATEPRTDHDMVRRHRDTLLGWLVFQKGDSDTYQALRPVVDDLLAHLEPREADVLRLRFGIDDGYPESREEISRRLGLSAWQVEELEERALAKLHQTVVASYFGMSRN